MLKVGIPRGLLYYKFFPLWKCFFENLGVKVIFSPPTNRYILDKGCKSCVDEVCLPVKNYCGHVDFLKDKVDFIFAPRFVSIESKEYSCPKFLGIPDILISNINNLPKMISPTIDFTKDKKSFNKIVGEVGKNFTNNSLKIKIAWELSKKKYANYKKQWYLEKFPNEMGFGYLNNRVGAMNVLVIGHDYIIYDPYLSMNLLQKLHRLNIDIYTTEMVPDKIIKREVKDIPKRIFWDFARNTLGTVIYYTKKRNIFGIIQVSSFGCGPDSMTNSMINHYLKNNFNIPLLNLTIDEHTGEAGINTRIEAFKDLLMRRTG